MLLLTLHLLLLLVFGHMLADFPLQQDFLVQAKRGLVAGYPWWVGMGAHAGIQAGFVLLFTNLVTLFFVEFALHFAIDMAKCRNKFGATVDQLLHILCKVFYVALIIIIKPHLV